MKAANADWVALVKRGIDKGVFDDQDIEYILEDLKFVPKPIIIYGDSGSGKSTYLKEIIGLTGSQKLDCCCIYSNELENK